MAENSTLRSTDEQARRLARTLIRTARYGALSFLDPETGAPGVSRIAIASDTDGTPVTLISGLSAHTRALQKDERCGLLVGEPGTGNPMIYPRLSLMCRSCPLDRDSQKYQHVEQRFLNRHPQARTYARFADFLCYRLDIENGFLNGGFGKAYALSREDLQTGKMYGFAPDTTEQTLIDQFNHDHGNLVADCARRCGGLATTSWIITGIDEEGMDLCSRDETVRFFFEQRTQGPLQSDFVLQQLTGCGT